MKNMLYTTKYILLIICIAFTTIVDAQMIGHNKVTKIKDIPKAGSVKTTKIGSKNTSANKASSSSKSKTKHEKQDTIYSTGTKKQFGWFAPIDNVSKEYTTHCNVSFRFTNKNKNGKWLKMETIDAYGNLTSTKMSPYIIKKNNENDSVANKDWLKKLEGMSIYEFIPDPSGKNIMQERAYDKDHNLIYTYVRTPITKNMVIGSYKDNYGLPAEMRPDPNFSYGTLVRITEDHWGNDSIIEYLDSKGNVKANADGAYSEMFVHDKYGNVLKQASRDKDGNFMRDSWGNCGIEYKWNADHTCASAMYTDENWKPMRMPSEQAGDHLNVIKTIYEYDKYKRQTKVTFIDSDNNTDHNAYGCHMMTYEYDEHGNLVRQCGFDRDGNYVAMDKSGEAIVECKYDNSGKMLDIVLKDTNGNPNPTTDYLSKMHWEYDVNGNQKLFERYSVVSGIEKLIYKEDFTNPMYKKYRYTDNIYRVDSLDIRGRELKKIYFDDNNNLYNHNGIAITKTQYVDAPGRCTQTQEYYDKNRHLVSDDYGVAIGKQVTDSTKNVIQKFAYDKNQNLISSFAWITSDEMIKTEIDVNGYGIPCRAGGTAAVRHYCADVIYAPSNKFATLVGRDEFGESDYITSNSKTYYYQKLPSKGSSRFLDENSNEITDLKTFRDSLPKVMTIEVVDSIAYNYGLKDNDVIIKYGSYMNLLYDCSFFNFKALWGLHSVLDADKTKDMLVFRINPQTKEYGLVQIKGLKGTPSQLGFMAHYRFLTSKQKNRIEECLKKRYNDELDYFLDQLSNSLDDLDVLDGDNTIILEYPDLFRQYRNQPFSYFVKDPAIILGVNSVDSLKSWNMGKAVELFDNIYDNCGYDHPVRYYMTTNLTSTKCFESMESIIGATPMQFNVNDSVYNIIRKTLPQHRKDFDKYMKDVAKIQLSFTDGCQRLLDSVSNCQSNIVNEYNGVDNIRLYDLDGLYDIQDRAFPILHSIKNTKKEPVDIGTKYGYGSILKFNPENNKRIEEAIIYNARSIIYAKGDFSKIQLNKMSNQLK